MTSSDTTASDTTTVAMADLAALKYDDRGLITVVAQDVSSGAVLMVAWANPEAVQMTLQTGVAHFWSRSRECLWRKGETSGNELQVVEILPDCDRDTLLLRVHPKGPACHTGERTCFGSNDAQLELGWLAEVLNQRRQADAESSYTAKLLAKGLPRIAQKVGEEAVETVIAALTQDGGGKDDKSELISESADLLYHLLVLWTAADVAPQDVAAELVRRHKGSNR